MSKIREKTGVKHKLQEMCYFGTRMAHYVTCVTYGSGERTKLTAQYSSAIIK